MKLWRYIQGNRKGKEAHRIEKEAMKDPFLADALEGYEKTQGNHQREVARLQKQITRLQKRDTKRSIGKKPNHLKAWSIAAGILIVVGVGTWFLLNDSPISKDIQTITQSEMQTAVPTASGEARKILPDTTETLSKSPAIAQVTPKTEDKKEKQIAEPIIMAEEEAYAMEDVMIEDVTLSAVSTSQQAKTRVAETSQPQPITGMEAYMNYIQKNLKRPTDEECRNAKGPVVVVFKIGQSGRPYNIRVTQGLCSSTNKEAIRLIINGPDWKKGSTSDEATITINF
ncbi:hypothetical protein [Bacteroides sp. 51]|uniref:hypothetical protein n=1 Tax=Bacteroides sp. 51 TaxID=2302938 RepID=UPI0013D63D7F|nr:hypothetical protein [Bacteroides sp. 51]NDV82790.1 hypothetical protein [Bacteroides sp. 51]